jgi:hypothetical protein
VPCPLRAARLPRPTTRWRWRLSAPFFCALKTPLPCSAALACTCRSLSAAALLPHRAQLAAACWTRAFGSATLGPCAAWQRAEQLAAGSAAEARWRWLHGLRALCASGAGARAAVRECTVLHALPTAADMAGLEYEADFDKMVGKDCARTMLSLHWVLQHPAFIAVGEGAVEALQEAFCCGTRVLPPCDVSFRL